LAFDAGPPAFFYHASMRGDDEPDAAGWPVMLNLNGRRCVVVGGGPTAARRAESLVASGAQVVVVAPEFAPRLDGLLVERRERGYEAGDLDGAFLVVVATDRPEVNRRVAADAEAAGVLVNRADEPGAGDVTAMAAGRSGPVTVAVDSGGSSAAAGRAMLDELLERLDPDWPVLLAAARPWRRRVQRAVADPGERALRLRRLTDDQARHILRDHGEAGLAEHLRRVAEGAADPATPADYESL
jgi:precorrin-2 dehydrogenase/sirohydrochlorin ferrochelatase